VPVTEHWQDEPEDHDFPAAVDYLSLLAPQNEVDRVVDALRSAQTIHRKAKDLLRASRLSLLPADNVHVRKDLSKVAEGKHLSPVLLVRGRGDKGMPLTIADGTTASARATTSTRTRTSRAGSSRGPERGCC
jgi:hypothetical protein